MEKKTIITLSIIGGVVIIGGIIYYMNSNKPNSNAIVSGNNNTGGVSTTADGTPCTYQVSEGIMGSGQPITSVTKNSTYKNGVCQGSTLLY